MQTSAFLMLILIRTGSEPSVFWQRINTIISYCSWVLEKILESPLDCKEIKPVNYKGNKSRIFIGRTDTEAEAPVLWPPDGKNWLIGKDPDAGKDWRQEDKGMTVDEMVGWHHRFNGHVWVSSGSWWWTGKPGVLQSMESQTVRHDWVTKVNWFKKLFSLKIPNE